MKIEMKKQGLLIEPENEIEAYALEKWCDENIEKKVNECFTICTAVKS